MLGRQEAASLVIMSPRVDKACLLKAIDLRCLSGLTCDIYLPRSGTIYEGVRPSV